MSISRRKFLGRLGAAGACSSLASAAEAAPNMRARDYSDSMGVLCDISFCVGCRSCEEACNKVNDLPKPEKPFSDKSVFNKKRRTSAVAKTVVNKYENVGADRPVFRKIQCNHCLEPACASACFVKALRRNSKGAVVYNPDLCVGCRYCMVACPFNIPAYEYDDPVTPKVVKSHFCMPRQEKGMIPGCVESCPTEALVFGKRQDLLQIARKRIHVYKDRYVDHIYGEKEMGGTAWLYLSPVSFEKIGMREDLGMTPAPSLTSGFLSVVPLVAGMVPVFLTGMYGMTQRRKKVALEEKEEAVAEAIEKTNLEAEANLKEALQKAADDKAKALLEAGRKKEKAVEEALLKAAEASQEGNKNV